ncbi:tricalbin [Cryphonectria parasitica EP155]|uniref:Tricalbin n=1 Tax=Cryphonectria parasitica (strain ATCC 38755 / EP155) TaxID=660469 RepID=A0A9P4Y8V2_CRYP1|nr:tricalbin [Cryphonectria parasitica EP155]KAF3769104.1 tricalbin [Cryphonectria parasitica EP155]
MATEQAAEELKQQGAMEASRDPESSVTAEDAEKKILEETRSAGVAAFKFNPDASPAEKKAQAREAVPEGFHSNRRKGAALVTDRDGGEPDYDIPEDSKAGAIEVSKDAGGRAMIDGKPADGGPEMGPQTGWAPQFGWPVESAMEGESLLDHQTWLEGKIPDKFYGDWYYNAAVIAFACISSWFVAVLGGGLGWVFTIMACCATYYRTSLRRVRRNFRDDLNREVNLKRLETDTESLEWINSFLVKFWPIYQPVLAATIISSVDQVLSGATPGFLDSLRLKEFTLGSKPPRMEHVKTYPKAEDDVVIMDWKFSFTPNDTADMTSRQIKSKINPKVVLEIRIGKAMVSKGLDVIVEDMAFEGIMRLKIKLQLAFPHVEKIEMCFLERPTIDYVCKPLGGETFGFDINFIPGLESFILEQIHGNLAPMMYAPNVFPIEVAKMLAGSPVDQAIGVVAITLHGAQGLKNPDNFSGNPDPYAVVTLNKRQALAQTKTVKDNPNPRWNETHYIIVTSFNDTLDIQVFDWNEFRKDKELGTASFSLSSVEEIYEHENERLEIKSGGKARGALMCDIRFFPVLEATKGPDGTEEPLPDTPTGILRFTVEQAKDLDGSKSLVGQLNPYAHLLLNGKEIHTTKKLKRTNNPIWDNGTKEILITDRKAAKLGVVIKDDRDLAGDQILGTYSIKLEDMLDLMAKGQDWYNISGAKTGRVKMQAQWRPVALSGIVAGTGGYQTPIGLMRFHFQSARNLRNFETMGKSDPYVRVSLSGIERARTVTHRNTLNPDFDEVLYVPVHSNRERLQIEVMDAEKMGKDRSLGLIDIHAADYVHQDESGEYLVHDQKSLHDDGLKLHGKGTPKGLLKYTVAFYPTLNIADPEDEEEEKEQEKQGDTAVSQNGDVKASLDVPRPENPGKFSSTVGAASGDADKDAARPVTPISPVSATMPRKSKDERQPPKIHLTPQELLKYESGLVIFKLMDAELPQSNSRVEVFVDDMAFPSYVSSTAKSKTYTFDEMGDCMIRELEFSKLTIKIKEKGGKPGEDDRGDHTLAQLTGNTLDTLKQCLNNPTTLKMKGEDGKVSAVKVSLKYIPINMKLDPSESINNMGNLRVDVLDATDLPSADSNGKSDPYCKFELNGQDVFKTKVQKKTLHPAWNEFFEVPVPSRTAAKFSVKVMDWDFADKPDFLGGADINLEQLEPFKAQEVNLILDGKSGNLRLRLLFRPDYVTRHRQGTSTFSGTFAAPGRIVTGVAGAPIKGATGIAHGVGKGASFIKRGFTGRKKDDDSIPESPAGGLAESPILALGATNGHSRTKSFGAASANSGIIPGAGAGTATFTIVSASGFPPSSDVYIVVQQKAPKSKTVGKTKHHKASDGVFRFGETFKCVCTPEASFALQAKENHTFKGDEDLGEHFLPIGNDEEKEYPVGDGSVLVRSTFGGSLKGMFSRESLRMSPGSRSPE